MRNNQWYFIGANFSNNQNAWSWIDGTNWNPWNLELTDPMHPVLHNYLAMNKNDDNGDGIYNGRWNQNDGTTSQNYICKMTARDKDRIYISRGKN